MINPGIVDQDVQSVVSRLDDVHVLADGPLVLEVHEPEPGVVRGHADVPPQVVHLLQVRLACRQVDGGILVDNSFPIPYPISRDDPVTTTTFPAPAILSSLFISEDLGNSNNFLV